MLLTPRFLREPVQGQLANRDVADLDGETLKSVIEGAALLQGIRAPVVAVPLLIVVSLFGDYSTIRFICLSLLFWIPAYMLILGACQLGVTTRLSAHEQTKVLFLLCISPPLALLSSVVVSLLIV